MSKSNVCDPSVDLLRTPCNYHQVALAEITIPPSRHPPEPEKVADLARSIKELGQLQPIGLTVDYRLIYGGRRKAACELLGHDSIDAVILNLDELHAELAEIDENVERRVLTVLEEARALARRKAIYLALHPDAKPVNEKGGPGRGKKTSDNLSPVSFAADAAKKTGWSARTIQRKVEIGEKLDSEAADMLRGTKYENDQSALKLLADLPVQKQHERAKELKAGAPPRILRKRKTTKHRKGTYVRTCDGVYRLAGRDVSGQFFAVGYEGGPVTHVTPSAILGSATKEEWLASRPAPNPDQLNASPAHSSAGDGGSPSDAEKLGGRAAEAFVDGDVTAHHPSDSQEIVKNGQHNPQMPPVATDVQTIFDTMTEGWDYNEKLEVLEKFFGEDSVNTMLRFIKASDLNEFKQFVQTYIEERKNT